jgi:hypothetical protein
MKTTRQALLTVLLFVSPLLFFTNLTRNPYVTQICALNIALLLWAALFGADAFMGKASLPRTPVDAPLAGWLSVCIVSWLVGYFGHAAFFRSSMINEGLRAFLFLLGNALVPFYLAALLGREGGLEEVPLAQWAVFSIAWGFLWTLFPQLRGPNAAPADIFGHFWDGYGAFVWAAGIGGVCW